jgi:hypothetical protein
MTPLYGHTSPETAYLVNDYPYGFRLRCKIRYWLEHDKKRGWRFCSQTTNPKRGDTWNKPKASTYVRFAACMCLNEEGHVTWHGVHEYSEAPYAIDFCQKFPGADLSELGAFAVAKACFCEQYASGNAYMTMNGKRLPTTEADAAKHVEEGKQWREVAKLCGI